jgi:hypothetical protein
MGLRADVTACGVPGCVGSAAVRVFFAMPTGEPDKAQIADPLAI